MAQAKAGDTVAVHYTGKLEDGTVFDSSEGGMPLEFAIGSGNVIPGFEEAVIGMSPGDTKTAKIPSDEAYGPYYEERVLVVDRQQIPADLPIDIGAQLQIQQQGGMVIPVVITDITDGQVTLDANHPLAGEDLTFEIRLVAIS
ncbi:MAG: FKBP-type peptidyl-prolyl cis-trans isomerase [Leptolyngbya sp. IPPAS B-1204]|uniref:Peptidyl-prolyl cis-trans isomerase n=1 Tax=Leptolyngbya sp. NK1-12 TaxID=2547451 RepID=A0AA96WCH4_9CYAN|nr:peptidylprolyl isomerase [Leptolyngbya sp. NK1-12]MBF2046724.1 peptidylprolyl isomerase [Elainella sp. C42_A2020_010]RNJ65374.1 MAG: peptidylprolyl isomerase [Leptolyngbya sp. IPPAS B-1204]WNZ22609.1 peptidylprolyl isomerase [Leptolyngbya sp. NK1-12]